MKSIHENSKPLYLTIREDILREFEINNNRNIPTEKELCDKYKVCRPTVTKALAYFVENDMIIRRPGKGSYFREDALRDAAKIQEVWGIIRQDWESWTTDFYFCTVIQGLVSSLGADFRLCLEKYSPLLLNRLLSSPNAATVWISPEHVEFAAMRQLADAERRVVAVNRHFDYPGIRTVSIDHPAAGRTAAREWVAAGAGRICAVHIESERTLYREMMSGFHEAVRGESLPLVCREVIVAQAEWQSGAKGAFRRLLAAGERAFFIGTTALVPMALEAIGEAGLKLGLDVSVLVYGDHFGYERDGIAALRQPGMELGLWAGQIVRGQKEGARHWSIPMEVVRRASLCRVDEAVSVG